MTNFKLGDLVDFDKMIAPKVAKLVYWLGLIVIALAVGSSLLGGLAMMQYSFSGGVGMLLAALFGGSAGTLMWRVFCEAYVVFFGIYDRLAEVRDAVAKKE
jgi:hypothetical protein